MPSKKRKYNARFPAGRIKRIMQADEEVGKIAQAVPVIISRTLELFVGSLLTKSSQITISRNAKTLSPTHLKQCIMSESRFDFLKDLVKNIPDISVEENCGATYENHVEQQIHRQMSVPASYNGLEQQSNGSSTSHQQQHSTIISPQQQQIRSFQRSQSFQPSTSTSSSQYHTPTQQKQFYLNNYTSTNNQNTKNVPPQIVDYRPQAKIARISSIPTATVTSEQKQLTSSSAATAASILTPLEFPIQISYNIDGPNDTATESPTVKIDYSKLSLPASSPSTTIKIDLSNFNSQITPTTTSSIQPSTASSTAASLDEDYDA